MNIQELLGIELPIIQAPMAGSQGSALAIAVSNAGALGSLPCAMMTAAGLHDELEAISSATTVDEAVWLEARGVDAVIAQGAEAGGHRGIFLSDDVTTQVGTLALLRSGETSLPIASSAARP